MTEYKIIWTPRAAENLKAIKEYIDVELCAPESALKIAQEIYEGASSLAQMPQRCPKDKEVPEYRFLIVGNYFIYFRIKEPIQVVEISFIRNQRQQRLQII